MPRRPENFRSRMKHLNGKQKNKTNQKKKKTSQKPGFSNSGEGYNISKNLRSRCIVENTTSIIKHEMRRYPSKSKQFTPRKKEPNRFPAGFSNTGEGYEIIHKNLRSRCIVENGDSVIEHDMRTYQMDSEVSFIGNERKTLEVENVQFADIENTHSIFPPVYKSTERYTGLNTFKNKAVTFFFENGEYEIFVEDLIGNQERGSLSVDFFSYKNSDEGDPSSLVVLKPRPSDIDLQVHANDQNLELHESKNQNSAQENKFFFLHETTISGCVSFECLRSQGLYIGVKENRLELMEKKEDDEAFMFRLTK